MIELPKLPPDAIVRFRIGDWLDANAARRVRIVSGQPGAGKTVAVAAWARYRPNAVRWLTVAAGATETDLRALLAEPVTGELVVDGADRAAPDGRAFLAELAPAAPGNLRVIYLVRDTRMFEAPALGEAALMDATLLRFDEGEIERFCTAHGVGLTTKDRQRFATATGG